MVGRPLSFWEAGVILFQGGYFFGNFHDLRSLRHVSDAGGVWVFNGRCVKRQTLYAWRITGWWQLKHFSFSTPYLGRWYPNIDEHIFFQTDGLVGNHQFDISFLPQSSHPKKGNGTETPCWSLRCRVSRWGGCQLCGGWPIHNWWSFGVAFGREAKISEQWAGREVYGQGEFGGCFFFFFFFWSISCQKQKGGGLGGLARWDSNERCFIRKLAAIPPFCVGKLNLVACRSLEMIPNFLLMSLNSTWLRRRSTVVLLFWPKAWLDGRW